MEKTVAKSILDAALSMSKPLDDLFSAIDAVADESLKTKLHEHAAYLMRDITLHFIFPIADMYPDLDPER